jgi:hypothetical protein
MNFLDHELDIFGALLNEPFNEASSPDAYTSSEDSTGDGTFEANSDLCDWDGEAIDFFQLFAEDNILVNAAGDENNCADVANIPQETIKETETKPKDLLPFPKKHELNTEHLFADASSEPTKKSKPNQPGRPRARPAVINFPTEIAEAFNSGLVERMIEVVSNHAVPDCGFKAAYSEHENFGRDHISNFLKFVLGKSEDIVMVAKNVQIENRTSLRFRIYLSWSSEPYFVQGGASESSYCKGCTRKSFLEKMDLTTLSEEQVKALADREKKLQELDQKVQVASRADIHLKLNRYNQITRFNILQFKILSFDAIDEDIRVST